jgi:hypothetical protein
MTKTTVRFIYTHSDAFSTSVLNFYTVQHLEMAVQITSSIVKSYQILNVLQIKGSGVIKFLNYTKSITVNFPGFQKEIYFELSQIVY